MPQKNKIIVTAPATFANFGPGFDVFGIALNKPADITQAIQIEKNRIEISFKGYSIPIDPKKNTIAAGAKAVFQRIGKSIGIRFIINKRIPPGSGLGSSGASAATGAFVANYFLGNPLTDSEVIACAAEGEAAIADAHADNVAPCLLGGFTIIRSYNPIKVEKISPPDMRFLFITPKVDLKTSEARAILPKHIPIKDVVKTIGNTASIIKGIYEHDLKLIGESMSDFIAEPYRANLIPGYKELKKRFLEEGALGVTISGAGPTIALLIDKKAELSVFKKIVETTYSRLNIDFSTFEAHPGKGIFDLVV
ncbi:MAG: homoserine kinase [Candidatus Asgardarchaeia archaeon]